MDCITKANFLHNLGYSPLVLRETELEWIEGADAAYLSSYYLEVACFDHPNPKRAYKVFERTVP